MSRCKSLFLSHIAMIALLSGCASSGMRLNSAEEIATKGNLSRRDLRTEPFILASWQRVSDLQAPVHVYIEGDGLAWLSRSTPSLNPTPTDPVGLKLASVDPAVNVVYLARPCQYTDLNAQGQNCQQAYWTDQRFAAEVIASYDEALDRLKAQGFAAGFELIGYSGGANIAGLLAARRDDVLSLRSVAGNVDNDFFTQFHHVSAMPLSLNMADFPEQLRVIPQYHFIAAQDKFVPPEIFNSYQSKFNSGYSACVQFSVVPETTHAEGWGERWPHLLKQRPAC